MRNDMQPAVEMIDDIDRKEEPSAQHSYTHVQGKPDRPPLDCPRCSRELAFLGRKMFCEQDRLFTEIECFDLYGCEECGHAQLFLPGVGLKSHTQISTMVGQHRGAGNH